MLDRIYWLDVNQTILVVKIPEYWSWHEMHDLSKFIGKLMDEQSVKTQIIVDFQKWTFVPQESVANTAKILKNLHPMIDALIFTGLSISHRSILETLGRLYPHLSKPIIIADNPYNVYNKKIS